MAALCCWLLVAAVCLAGICAPPAAAHTAAVTVEAKHHQQQQQHAVADSDGGGATTSRGAPQRAAAPSSSSSTSVITSLAVSVLVHNLMPRPLPPRIAAATTAGAWMWLALTRLQPWLMQQHQQQLRARPSGFVGACGAGCAAGGDSGSSSAGSAQADAMAAAAGLSPASATATGVAQRARSPGQALLLVSASLLEVPLTTALDAVLLMGLLLLPVLALQRWRAGHQVGGAIPAAAGHTARYEPDSAERSSASLRAAAALGQASQAAASTAARELFEGTCRLEQQQQQRAKEEEAALAAAAEPGAQQPTAPSHAPSGGGAAFLAQPATPPLMSMTRLSDSKDPSFMPCSARPGIAGLGIGSSSSQGSLARSSGASASSGGFGDGGATAAAGQTTPDRASLDLGSAGLTSTAVRPPVYPGGRALYSSPLETLVVSCKLTNSPSSASSGSSSAGGGTARGAIAGSSSAAGEAPSAQSGGPGHGDSIAAQRQLRALVEAAVRRAVSSSGAAVLSTTTTSFPGCVHVVTTVNLQALAAADGSRPEGASTMAWREALQHILDAQDGDGLLAAEGLELKHMLVQDGAARSVHMLWTREPSSSSSASSAGDDGVGPSSAASSPASVLSGRPGLAAAAGLERAPDGFSAAAHSRLMQAASAAVLSRFALPVDELPGAGAGAGSAGGCMLQLLPVLADALGELGADLRIVITGSGCTGSAHEQVLVDHVHAAATGGSEVDVAALLQQQQQPGDLASVAAAQGHALTIHLLAAAAPAAGAAAPASASGVLLQLPLLLLPSAACTDLQRLSARMAEELGDAAAATQAHLLPLVRDVAAAMAAQAAVTTAAAAAAAAAIAAGSHGPDAGMLLPDVGGQALLGQLLPFLEAHGLQALAAAVSNATPALLPHAASAPQGPPEIQEDNHNQDPGSGAGAASGAGPAGAASPPAPAEPAAHTPFSKASAGAGAAHGGPASRESATAGSTQAAKVMEQATAAREQALAAQRAAAATGEALQLALGQITALTAAANEAGRQAAGAEAAALAATRRAAGVEALAERQRALQLISAPGATGAVSERGPGIWGLLVGGSRAALAAAGGGGSGDSSGGGGGGGAWGSDAAAGAAAAGPPRLPAAVSWHDTLFGFPDERLEVQYRRLKALHASSLDRAALAMQSVRQAVYVWRIARVMLTTGSGLSLVLLCKYEAVVLLPYLVMLVTPEFYVCHRHLLLCLSQLAAALTVGMIAATEIYRNEWGRLMQHPGPVVLARPSMMLAWFYVVVPLLQQQTMPEQTISCVAQFVHQLLVYLFIFKGPLASLWVVVPLLLAASGVSFGLTFVLDARERASAVAAARRGLQPAAVVGA